MTSGLRLSPRQRVAIENTCRLPEETTDPRFRALHGWASSILTFNSGFE